MFCQPWQEWFEVSVLKVENLCSSYYKENWNHIIFPTLIHFQTIWSHIQVHINTFYFVFDNVETLVVWNSEEFFIDKTWLPSFGIYSYYRNLTLTWDTQTFYKYNTDDVMLIVLPWNSIYKADTTRKEGRTWVCRISVKLRRVLSYPLPSLSVREEWLDLCLPLVT